MSNKKLVLGFSGGLDTTYCAKYLGEDLGYEVHSITVDTGGFSDEELKQIEEKAYSLGVKSHTTINAVKDYYDRIIQIPHLRQRFKKQYLPPKRKRRAAEPGPAHCRACYKIKRRCGCPWQYRRRQRPGSFRHDFSHHDPGC